MKNIAGFKLVNGCAVLSESVAPAYAPVEVFKNKILGHISPISSNASFTAYIKEVTEGIESSFDLPMVIQHLRTDYRGLLEEMVAAIKNEIDLPSFPENQFDEKLFSLYRDDITKFFNDNDITFKDNYDVNPIDSWDLGENLKMTLTKNSIISGNAIMTNDPGTILLRINYQQMLARPEYKEATVFSFVEYSLRNATASRKTHEISRYYSLYDISSLTKTIKSNLTNSLNPNHCETAEYGSSNDPGVYKTRIKMVLDDLLNEGETALFAKILELSKDPIFANDFRTSEDDLQTIMAVSFSNIIYAMISYYSFLMLALLSEFTRLRYLRQNYEVYSSNRPELLKALGLKE